MITRSKFTLAPIKDIAKTKVPNQCIEAAQYFVRCFDLGGVIPINIAKGVSIDTKGNFIYGPYCSCVVEAEIFTNLGRIGSVDIDKEDLNDAAYHRGKELPIEYPQSLNVGEGICIIANVKSNERKAGQWTLHAAACLQKDLGDKMTLASTFADDNAESGFINFDVEQYQTTDDFIKKFDKHFKKTSYNIAILRSQ